MFKKKEATQGETKKSFTETMSEKCEPVTLLKVAGLAIAQHVIMAALETVLNMD